MPVAIQLPPPAEIGFPPTFTEWRPVQLDAIDQAISTECRHVGQCAPTGSGKSAIAIGQAIVTGDRTLIATATKSLQDQYQQDFESSVVADIRGKNAYQCREYPTGTCEDGNHLHCVFRETARCPHNAATVKAQSAPIVITNYRCYILNYLEGKGWGKFDRLILDEAHDAVDQVSESLSLVFTRYEANIILDTPLPDDTADDWIEFARHHAGRLERKLEREVKLLHSETNTPHQLRRVVTMKRLLQKLNRVLALCVEGEWIVESEPEKHTLQVLWPAPWTERVLFRETRSVVLLSATISPDSLELLGIPRAAMDFREFPSDFPPGLSPVYLLPSVNVDHRMTDASVRQWISLMDTVIRGRLDRKGITHSVSYARTRDILASSEFGRYMIAPESGHTAEKVALFKRMPPPAVLVSPAVHTGQDFPGEACEYQILSKVPFPDTRSLITKVRCEADPLYGPYLTAQKLTQAVGRGTRSSVDMCENFIIDRHMRWFYPKHKLLFPAWFRAQVRWQDSVPRAAAKYIRNQ